MPCRAICWRLLRSSSYHLTFAAKVQIPADFHSHLVTSVIFQFHLRTTSFPCQSLQPSREFCPSPYIVLKFFQHARFFRKKWKSKTFSLTKLHQSWLYFPILKSHCQSRASIEGATEGLSIRFTFPLLPPLFFSHQISSMFDTIAKIYCTDLDLIVSESATQTTLASKSSFR